MLMAKILTGGVGLAALASAVPATAQYYFPQRISTQAAVSRCTAAVQQRLSYNNGYSAYSGYYGNYASPRVVSVTRVEPRRNSVRVAGLASSGRMAYNYGPFGIGAYGLLGSNYNQAADLRFGCSIDRLGRVTDLDLNRR
jgi:hypothetical protein